MAQLTGRKVGPRPQAHRLGELLRLSAEHAIGDSERSDGVAAVGEHRVLEVLPHSQLREDGRDLERAANSGPRDQMRRLAGDVAAVEDDLPRGWLQLAGQKVEQRRLARAVRTDDGATVTPFDLEAHVFDRA